MLPDDGHVWRREEPAMNQSVHQLLRLILEGFTWFLKTIEALWDWSWAQIISAFRLSWADLPGWKIVVGLIAIAILVALLAAMFRRALTAFGRIAAAFWTMAMTVFGGWTPPGSTTSTTGPGRFTRYARWGAGSWDWWR